MTTAVLGSTHTMDTLIRLIVAIATAAVIVWLLGGHLPGLIVGLLALAAFLLIMWAPGRLGRGVR